MKGIKSRSLTAIIDFLYLGEANVVQEELDNFLALAEELQLKGLGNNAEEKFAEHQTETFDRTERTLFVNQKQNDPDRKASSNLLKSKPNVFEGTMVMPYQQKPKLNSLIEPATMAIIESLIEKRIDGIYCCTNCGYTSKNRGHMREHVEKHIDGLEYPCNACNKIMRSSNSFRVHRIRDCRALKN